MLMLIFIQCNHELLNFVTQVLIAATAITSLLYTCFSERRAKRNEKKEKIILEINDIFNKIEANCALMKDKVLILTSVSMDVEVLAAQKIPYTKNLVGTFIKKRSNVKYMKLSTKYSQSQKIIK